MRRAIIFAIGLFVLGLAPAPAQARETYTGTDLLENCRIASVCDTFFIGLLDAYVSIRVWAGLPGGICIPNGHLIWPFINEDLLAAPDEQLQQSTAASLVLNALRRRYSCEAGQPAVVQPAFLSGLDLSGLCQDTGLCEAFLIGVLDTHRTLVEWGELAAPHVCLPTGVENDELMLSFLTYLQGRQDQIQHTGGSLMILALSESYGCGP